MSNSELPQIEVSFHLIPVDKDFYAKVRSGVSLRNLQYQSLAESLPYVQDRKLETTNKVHLLLLRGTEQKGALPAPWWCFFRVCGQARNKDDRTILGSGRVGPEGWFSVPAYALGSPWGLFLKNTQLETHPQRFQSYWSCELPENLNYCKDIQVSLIMCSISGVLYKEEAINHEYNVNLLMHDQPWWDWVCPKGRSWELGH